MKRTLTVVAALAMLLLSVTGGAVAASKVTGKQIKDSTITSKDVKDKSLTAKDFRKGSLPEGERGPKGDAGATGATGATGSAGTPGAQGPQGPQGAQGSTGPRGPAGPVNLSGLVQVAGPEVALGPLGSGTEVNGSSAVCPSGYRAISGGYVTITGDAETFASLSSSDRRTWFAGAANHASIEGSVQAFAYCARAGSAVGASGSSASAEAKALIAKARAAMAK